MIYFDNASSTLVNEDVLDFFTKENLNYFANPNSNNSFSNKIEHLINNIRKDILLSLNLDQNIYEVIFTSSATESNNLALLGYAKKNKNKGKGILTSKIEHASVLKPLEKLNLEGFYIDYLDLESNALIDLNSIKEKVDDKTILVSLMGVNNETGNILNLKEVVEEIKKISNKVIIHSDLAQAYLKVKIDYSIFDMFTLSSYKVGGLKGLGILVKKKKINLEPIIFGGGQENNLRSGTVNYPLISSFNYLIKKEKNNIERNYSHVKSIRDKIIYLIKNDEYLNNEIIIHDYLNQSPYILSFSLKNKSSSVIVESLSNKDIYVSTKSSCSDKINKESYVIYELTKSHKEALNSIRLSFSKYNSIKEVDEFIFALKESLMSIRG